MSNNVAAAKKEVGVGRWVKLRPRVDFPSVHAKGAKYVLLWSFFPEIKSFPIM